jgi:hypothetical protein
LWVEQIAADPHLLDTVFRSLAVDMGLATLVGHGMGHSDRRSVGERVTIIVDLFLHDVFRALATPTKSTGIT